MHSRVIKGGGGEHPPNELKVKMNNGTHLVIGSPKLLRPRKK